MNLRSPNQGPFPAARAAALCAALALALAAPADATTRHKSKPRKPRSVAAKPAPRDGQAEARLLDVYRLVGQGQARLALARAEALVREHPHFQLAQLVYGDLLASRTRPVRTLGDVPEGAGPLGAQPLAELREESRLRVRALLERPPAGTVPSQFVQLSRTSRHAIAIDTSLARLYFFENTAGGLKLLGDYYVSVGKQGIEKAVEGDLRTPLGVYYITSNLDPKTLKDFYGAGALPINYPNPYDARRGKTGSGIWLHGTPPGQFSRAPRASDGCVVLANPDLERLLRTVEIRSTPVVIAPSLQWVAPATLQADARPFADALAAWRAARSSGDTERLLPFYAADFSAEGKGLAEWIPQLRAELGRVRGRGVQLKDVSYLRWTDSAETMVVTFGEVPEGARSGTVKRQYWMRMGPHWKIFYEGVIG
ncbi:L,D-transpeptidase family protein [Ramlibacter sp.]|uniref:L,D-transpeptidase family protein n=1 Tax=Ramlibacter sp. TaxID=1917967 RepID=UPI002FC5F2AF